MMAATPQMIEAAATGDQQALLRLLAVCQPDLRRYARRTCATEDIEEAVQDALLILYRRLGTLRIIATFSGWLFQIVKRACLQRLRRRGLVSLDEEAASGVQDPTDIELRLDLARSIMALPKIYREVVILRDVEELSTEETANEIGASVEAVKSRLHRGRYLIRQQLR
jgi:RNA polymerase sigma factor (sigma-70 family)